MKLAKRRRLLREVKELRKEKRLLNDKLKILKGKRNLVNRKMWYICQELIDMSLFYKPTPYEEDGDDT